MDELVSDLNTLLRYETASLMQFMGEATPYVHPDMLRAWQTVQKMASRASGRAARLTALLTSRRWPALPTVHDSDVAGLQYSRLEALLPRLVQEATQNVAMIEQAPVNPTPLYFWISRNHSARPSTKSSWWATQ